MVCIISEQILIWVLFLIIFICATIGYSCYLYALLSSNVRSQSICQIKICSEKQNRKNHIIRIKLLMHICKQSLIAEIELKIWFNNLFFLLFLNGQIKVAYYIKCYKISLVFNDVTYLDRQKIGTVLSTIVDVNIYIRI